MSWRDDAVPHVERAIRDGKAMGLEGKALVRYCNKQFPWGSRELHPYKIWKSEVKRQLGLIKFGERARSVDLAGQALLF